MKLTMKVGPAERCRLVPSPAKCQLHMVDLHMVGILEFVQGVIVKSLGNILNTNSGGILMLLLLPARSEKMKNTSWER